MFCSIFIVFFLCTTRLTRLLLNCKLINPLVHKIYKFILYQCSLLTFEQMMLDLMSDNKIVQIGCR